MLLRQGRSLSTCRLKSNWHYSTVLCCQLHLDMYVHVHVHVHVHACQGCNNGKAVQSQLPDIRFAVKAEAGQACSSGL